ncbi:DUF5687 family protein [Seonamhaeicola aphaedonensis]|uniref:ABC-2 type transport system permease protein n=1 Tax=Seonamhaeicola aphaedonensis TaxID=1461338 RepID=A0A3D9HIX9_9FLAO|nr:DUF5687 family protein [Seonamhaeicola aphaedonensis]RED48916.1 hypothetical protein DFQ02_103247 [Seonamhaeicola aphaedonensis]
MVKHFISLEWKSFFRSASFGKSLAIKIFMGFFASYLALIFASSGFLLMLYLERKQPETDPFLFFNGLIFFWFLGDLLIRFFFQKLPVMTVKPFLTLPVNRGQIVNYVLKKSMVSFVNFLPLLTIIPFGILLIVKGYTSASVVISWWVMLILLILINNFLNFIIESLSAERELSFLPIILLTSILYGLNYFDVIDLASLMSKAVTGISKNPYYLITPIAILGVLYGFNFNILIKKLYLDSGLRGKVKEVNAANLEWTKSFGDIAPFLQLDLKMIWRNKRTKSSVWILLMGLFYGLFFYPQPTYQDLPWFFMLIGVFSTGIFLISFGQFIPAWDSGYYKLLMSQNIKYEQYLKSKFTLMAFSVVVLFILGIPYVYFGWKVLIAHFVAAIYNIGVNTHVILYGGSFNRKKINLDQKAAFNYQGTGAVQWLIGIPLLLFPMGLFALLYFITNFEIACAILSLFGVIGIVFHQKLMKSITDKYTKSKYKMIDAFDQEN